MGRRARLDEDPLYEKAKPKETNLHKEVLRHLPGVATRVENTVVSGVFDTNLAFNNIEYWLEMKIRRGTQIQVRGSQYRWGRQRLLVGMTNLFFLVGSAADPPELYAATYILSLCSPSHTQGKTMSVSPDRAMSRAIGWKEIRQHLYPT